MNETIPERVIRNVADANGVDAVELPPLYDAIDPEALSAVVTTMSGGGISFTYAEREVTVTSDGEISLLGRSTGHSAAGAVVGDD